MSPDPHQSWESKESTFWTDVGYVGFANVLPPEGLDRDFQIKVREYLFDAGERLGSVQRLLRDTEARLAQLEAERSAMRSELADVRRKLGDAVNTATAASAAAQRAEGRRLASATSVNEGRPRSNSVRYATGFAAAALVVSSIALALWASGSSAEFDSLRQTYRHAAGGSWFGGQLSVLPAGQAGRGVADVFADDVGGAVILRPNATPTNRNVVLQLEDQNTGTVTVAGGNRNRAKLHPDFFALTNATDGGIHITRGGIWRVDAAGVATDYVEFKPVTKEN